MDLNQDVVIEILLHLPVKSVFRFRSVCKCRYKIMDSSSFRTSHVHYQFKNNKDEEDDVIYLQFRESEPFLFPDTWKSYNEFPADIQRFFIANITDRDGSNFIVDGPINGLILIYNESSRRNSPIAVSNPCLGEFKILPPSPMSSSSFICTQGIGFGFDNLTEEYKVVQLMSSYADNRTCVEVYSGRTNTWKKLDTDFFDEYYTTYYPEFRVIKSSYKSNSTRANWLIPRWRERERGRGRYKHDILSFELDFDMHNESFETIKLPESEVSVRCNVFAKDDDSLVAFGFDLCSTMVRVWELNKGRDGWAQVKNVCVGKNGWRAIALWKDGLVLRKRGCSRGKDGLVLRTHGCTRGYEWRKYQKYRLLYDCGEDEEGKSVALPNDGLLDPILEYKCTLFSVFGDMPLI